MTRGSEPEGRDASASGPLTPDRAPDAQIEQALTPNSRDGSRVLVILPAHDEEAVIARCIAALLSADSTAASVRVLVVANGCSDGTVAIARSFNDPRVQVDELSRAGKAAAVRHGLLQADDTDVVAVVDADVVLDPQVLPGLVAALSSEQARIAAPALRLDVSRCSAVMRRYWRSWLREAHVGPDDIGARGIYAVNRAGLLVLAKMPDLMADDGWARASFAPQDRLVSAGYSTVRPAQGLVAQVRRRTRVLEGNRELRAALPLSRRPPVARGAALPVPRTLRTRLLHEPLSETLAWYCVELPARVSARWHRYRRVPVSWNVDKDSRRT